MKRFLIYCTIICGLPLLAACSSSSPLPAVEEVDLQRYQGLWYDIAHLPGRQQPQCECITFKYNLLEDFLEAVRTCVSREDDSLRSEEGRIFSLDTTHNATLQAQWNSDFNEDYFILALSEDYRYAMVGTTNRQGLWILSRSPEPAAMVMKEYLNLAVELGFDTAALEFTDQSCYAEAIE